MYAFGVVWGVCGPGKGVAWCGCWLWCIGCGLAWVGVSGGGVRGDFICNTKK